MTRRRPLRWLVVSAALLVALEALYVVAANGFLASAWGQERMNRRPERFSVRYVRARTWIPGRLDVTGLALSGGSRRSSWRVAVDSGRMTVSLPALARRHFRLRSGVAGGAEVEVDLLPRPDAPPPGRRGRGWLVTLDGLEVEPVRFLRLGSYRLEGAGRLRGGASFQARGPLELDVDELAFDGARLAAGDQIIAQEVGFSARIVTEPYRAGIDELADLLAGTSGALRLAAEAEKLGFLAAYLSRTPWLEIGGRGHLTADLTLSRGLLEPGSRLELVGPEVQANYFGLAARGSGRLTGGVPADGDHAEIEVALDDYSVTRPDDGARLLEGRGLELRLRNDSPAIDRPAAGIALSVELPPSRIPDLAAVRRYIPPATGLRLTGGSGELAASLRYDARTQSGEGRIELTASRAEASYGEVDLRTALSVSARLADARFEDGVFDVSGSRMSLTDTEVRRGGERVEKGWWGRIEIPRGTMTREPGAAQRPVELDGRITARLRDSGPVVGLVADRVPRLRWLDRLLDVPDVLAATDLSTRGERLSLRGLEVTGGEREGLEIRGELDLDSGRPQGVFFARWGRLSAAVGLGEERRSWRLVGARGWYDRQAADYRAGGPSR